MNEKTFNSNEVTLINTLSVAPKNADKLLNILKKGAEEIMTKQEGYISSSIYKSKDGKSIVVLAKWRDPKNSVPPARLRDVA